MRRWIGSIGATVIGTTVTVALALGNAGADPSASTRQEPARTRWVAAWAASPITVRGGIEDQSYRMVAEVATGGSAVRVRLTNALGRTRVRIDRASVALAEGSGPGVRPDSMRPLRFGGSPSVTLPAGGDRWSDPVPLPVAELDRLAISLYAKDSGPLTAHPDSLGEIEPAFLSGPGDHVEAVDATAFPTSVPARVAVSAVDVRAPGPIRVVAAFGDSTTAGAIDALAGGSTSWPEHLAQLVSGTGEQVSVVSAAIAGNRLVDDARGPRGVRRFERDALGLSGVTDVVVLMGVNDLHDGVEVPRLVRGYRALVRAAHRRGVRVFGATLTPTMHDGAPYEDGTYATPEVLEARRRLNRSILREIRFDGVIDLASALGDGGDGWFPGLSIDGIHPSAEGARALAEVVATSL